jgi:hypothetical protein
MIVSVYISFIVGFVNTLDRGVVGWEPGTHETKWRRDNGRSFGGRRSGHRSEVAGQELTAIGLSLKRHLGLVAPETGTIIFISFIVASKKANMILGNWL